MNKQVQLNLTVKQAEIVKHALDLFSRLGCVQTEEILHLFQFYNINGINDANCETERDIIRYNLKNIKGVLKVSHNGNIGIANSQEDFKISYDILQILRNKLAYEKNPEKNTMNIDYDDFLPTSNEKPCKIEIL